MNNRIRKEIDKLIERIYQLESDVEAVRTSGDIKEEMIEQLNEYAAEAIAIQDEIQTLADEEQEKFDNLPEGLQYSDRSSALEDAANALNDAACLNDDPIQNIISDLECDDDPDWKIDFSDYVKSLEEAQSY